MDPTTRKVLLSSSKKASAVFVDDVFSTFLFDGTGSAQTITNGIDLSGEGGMVWLKSRGNSYGHRLVDTERGATKALESYDTTAEAIESTGLTAFTNTGFTVGTKDHYNGNGFDMCAWTFRKCPGFFDVVTFSGNGSSSGQTISHSLGSTPGSIWVKRTSATEDWCVYHRSIGTAGHLRLNRTTTYITGSTKIANVTSTSFDVADNDVMVNGSGSTYVAYIFAHDEQSFGENGDEAIIKCGSYTGNDNSDGPNVNLGFEPQWLLVKRALSGSDWVLIDNMRGFTVASEKEARLFANTSSQESSFNVVEPNATGFKINTTLSAFNSNNEEYIYIAIRRPHKPPEAGSEVLAQKLVPGSSITNSVSVSGAGVTDMTFIRNVTDARNWFLGARLLGPLSLKLNTTDAETSGTFGTSVNVWDQMTGTKLNYNIDINANGRFYMNWQFTRKPGVFDVVVYRSESTSSLILNHNLGVVPEMMIAKRTSGANHWATYHKDINGLVYLNQNSSLSSGLADRFSQTPTATQVFLGSDSEVNYQTNLYTLLLFATLPGISKVGSYTGTGSDINVDCGFTAGARFVLIKRTDYAGNWFVFDTERGINSGNDSYILVNSTDIPDVNQDYIDPLNAGFTITSSAHADLNASGGNYIFLAIA